MLENYPDSRRLSARTIFLPFLLHTLLVIGSYLLAEYLPSRDPAGFINPDIGQHPLVSKLVKWDAHWYTYIVDYGYTTQSIVFFPVIIIFIKLLTFININTAAAGLIICNLFAFLSFWAMGAAFRLDMPESTTMKALLAYGVMPTAFFLNSIYTEPLFISFSLACIYFARQQKWWLAAAFAALATLTRNIGIILLLFLIVELYQNSSTTPRSKLFLLLPPAALIGFLLYNLWLTGNLFTFYYSQQLWGREFGYPWINIFNNILLIAKQWPYVEPGVFLDSCLVLLSIIGLTTLSLHPCFKIRPSYLALGWLWLIIPLFSTSPVLPLYSLSRFVLILFPLYIFLAQVSKAIFYSFMIVSSLTLLICASLFMNWYWIG